jgi:hypothetical protein
MGLLVEGAFDDAVLVNLFEAFKAECVTTGQGMRLLVLVVVCFKAYPTFKYRIHLILYVIFIKIYCLQPLSMFSIIFYQ